MPSQFIYGDDARLIAWAEERIPGCRFRDDARAIGHDKDGELVAVTVFDSFSTTGCFMHQASGARHWWSKEYGTVAFSYPFLQCAYPRVSTLISADHHPLGRFMTMLGWRREGVMRKAGINGEDLLLLGMLREECRFVPPPALWR